MCVPACEAKQRNPENAVCNGIYIKIKKEIKNTEKPQAIPQRRRMKDKKERVSEELGWGVVGRGGELWGRQFFISTC